MLDYLASALRYHRLYDCLCAEVCACYLDVENPLEDVLLKFGDGNAVGASGVCGVVDEDVYSAEFRDGALDHLLHAGGVGDVHDEGKSARTFGADLLGGALDVAPSDCFLVGRVAVRVSAGAGDDDIRA